MNSNLTDYCQNQQNSKTSVHCTRKEDGAFLTRIRVYPCTTISMKCDTIREGYDGTSVKFCVFIYNVEPGYVCNYLTGEWEEI